MAPSRGEVKMSRASRERGEEEGWQGKGGRGSGGGDMQSNITGDVRGMAGWVKKGKHARERVGYGRGGGRGKVKQEEGIL